MPPRKKKPTGPKPVDAIVHPDKRTNLPTADAQDFVAPEHEGVKSLRYPRDPSIDPQLVWRGKDDEDAQDLEVPAPPIFIQEKIDPRVLIENLRDTAGGGAQEPELSLFDSFDGLGELEMVEFYEHEANWSNRMILGDSLQVMTSLAEREGLRGRVQTIYFDPPYGIRFNSNFQWSASSRTVTDGRAEHVSREAEQIRAFRDTWALGIHSYLTYLRDRLISARELLTHSGSVFVQIGDQNVHRVRLLLDEVFGEGNFVSQIGFHSTSGSTSEILANPKNFVLWFAKDRDQLKFRRLFVERRFTPAEPGPWQTVEVDGRRERLSTFLAAGGELDSERIRVVRLGDTTSQRQGRDAGGASAMGFAFEFEGKTYRPSGTRGWSTTHGGLMRAAKAGRLHGGGKALSLVRYFDEAPYFPLNASWEDTGGTLGADKNYVVQTNTKVVERCLLMSSDPGDLVLDPTCGSGTTAAVAEQWGRRWITIDTSRVALTLARSRMMGARFPYYPLAKYSPLNSTNPEFPEALPTDTRAPARGFVYERVPHVTLRSIAGNTEIDEVWDRWEPQITEIRLALAAEVEGDCPPEWVLLSEGHSSISGRGLALLEELRRALQSRKREMDAAVSQGAEYRYLIDRPVEDHTVVRVAGPFTTESLAPHATMITPAERTSTGLLKSTDPSSNFRESILENVRTAGIQNGARAERLVFRQLDAFPGTYLHGVGVAGADEDAGAPLRTAIAIGPEYGTVNGAFIKQAAREAIACGGIDALAVLAFAFDPVTAGQTDDQEDLVADEFDTAAERSLGGLRVLLVRMNTDLLGGQDLRKTASANLFMVFGQPDIEIRIETDGTARVSLQGVDVYDPVGDEIRSDSTDHIALWMVDTNYNGESFFVRHCYFTGGIDPYKRLKTALKADIDEEAWASLYRTESRPFPLPETGKIAVKVINDYGDEVVQIFDVGPGA